MEYFEEVIAPEIRLRQLTDKSVQKQSLYDLIKELARCVPSTKRYRVSAYIIIMMIYTKN